MRIIRHEENNDRFRVKRIRTPETENNNRKSKSERTFRMYLMNVTDNSSKVSQSSLGVLRTSMKSGTGLPKSRDHNDRSSNGRNLDPSDQYSYLNF